MAEQVSSNQMPPLKAPPKRRRLLDASAIIPVPVYSNKVNTSLQLRAPVLAAAHKTVDVAADDALWTQFSSRETPASTAAVSDSDDEAERKEAEPIAKSGRDAVRSPSPPPPQSPAHKPSRKAARKISEINRRLQVINSLLSPEHQDRRPSRRRRGRLDDSDDDVVMVMDDDDDVIAVTPAGTHRSPPYASAVREIPLKVRCRTDVHKIHVLSSTPLSSVLAQLSVELKIPPPRLLLMRGEAELPVDATVGELGLGIADIIECVVMAAEVEDAAAAGSVITVRLQTKDRDSVQEFSLHREAALGSVFSRYLTSMSADARRKVRFHFDGGKVTANQTPAQLDMEDGDIIEVWT